MAVDMKIISVEQAGNGFYGFYETETDYVSFSLLEGRELQIAHKYPKKEYRDYEHFVGVMGKFDPYTWFLKNPATVDRIDCSTLNKICRKSGIP